MPTELPSTPCPACTVPKPFIDELNHAFTAEQAASKLTGADRENFLANYHYHLAQRKSFQQWAADLEKVNQVALNTWNRANLDTLTSDAAWQKNRSAP